MEKPPLLPDPYDPFRPPLSNPKPNTVGGILSDGTVLFDPYYPYTGTNAQLYSIGGPYTVDISSDFLLNTTNRGIATFAAIDMDTDPIFRPGYKAPPPKTVYEEPYIAADRPNPTSRVKRSLTDAFEPVLNEPVKKGMYLLTTKPVPPSLMEARPASEKQVTFAPQLDRTSVQPMLSYGGGVTQRPSSHLPVHSLIPPAKPRFLPRDTDTPSTVLDAKPGGRVPVANSFTSLRKF